MYIDINVINNRDARYAGMKLEQCEIKMQESGEQMESSEAVVPELSAESATSKQGRLERKMELEQVDA